VQASAHLGPAPRTLCLSGAKGPTAYERAEELVAIHGVSDADRPTFSYECGDIAVEPAPADVGGDARRGRLGPVYRDAGGRLAVPTGRVFVRFGEGDPAQAHEAELTDAGFEVEQVPRYASHAAWVAPRDRDVGGALLRLEDLRRIGGVQSVEPQLLREPGRRG
jgi:hypothetical protein